MRTPAPTRLRRRRRSRTTAAIASASSAAAEADRGPQRRCIVTGEPRDRVGLLRFVVGPDGEIVPDIEARLPGRGLWLTPHRDIVERAAAKRLFARAARRLVTVPGDLADRIEALLVRRCGDRLGLARRAGRAVSGFDRVAEALRRGKVAALLFALDGAEGGRRKLGAAGRQLPAASVLSALELGAAFGRDRTVHVAVGPGPLCGRLLIDLERLAGFRAAAALESGFDLASADPETGGGGSEAHD